MDKGQRNLEAETRRRIELSLEAFEPWVAALLHGYRDDKLGTARRETAKRLVKVIKEIES